MLTDPITLALPGAIVPKARPRHNKWGSYLPANYRDWKDTTVGLIRNKIQPLTGDNFSVDVVLWGKHSRRGDLDNILGSIMDALVQADILPNDNAKIVTRKSIQLIHNDDNPIAYIRISQSKYKEVPSWIHQPLTA